MSGRGGGGKGLGKGGAKRHRIILRDNIQGITKSSIRKLARRGGVKRVNGLVYEEVRGESPSFPSPDIWWYKGIKIGFGHLCLPFQACSSAFSPT